MRSAIAVDRRALAGTVVVLFVVLGLLAWGLVANGHRADRLAAATIDAAQGAEDNSLVASNLIGFVACLQLVPLDARSSEKVKECGDRSGLASPPTLPASTPAAARHASQTRGPRGRPGPRGPAGPPPAQPPADGPAPRPSPGPTPIVCIGTLCL